MWPPRTVVRSSTDAVVIRCSHCCGTGVTVKDVDAVFSKTRHTTCISPSLGGSGNPSVITARGIVCAIKVPAFSPLLSFTSSNHT